MATFAGGWGVRVLAALTLLWALPANAFFGSGCLKSDETALFYDTQGYERLLDGERNSCVVVKALVYEPEEGGIIRDTALGLVKKLFDHELDEEESRLFMLRATPFLVDHEGGRSLTLEIAGRQFNTGESGGDGFVDGVFCIPAEEAHGADSDGDGWIAVTSGPCASGVFTEDRRVFGAAAELLGGEGVSVVSDIDDTIKVSNVADTAELMANTFLRPYEAVDGMAGAYSRWAKEGAAFHYVSATPYQLYTPLHEFIADAGFPRGALYMRKLRLLEPVDSGLFSAPGESKRASLELLFERYPQRSFVLVGDSGELDPELYGELARAHRGQVAKVLIRDVTGEGGGTGDITRRMRVSMHGLPRSLWMVFEDGGDLPPLARLVTASVDTIEPGPEGSLGELDVFSADARSIAIMRKELGRLVQYVKKNIDIFSASEERTGREQKEALRQTWSRFLEYCAALQEIEERNADFLAIEDKEAATLAFKVHYAAFLAQYRYALEFMDGVKGSEVAGRVLNEPVPALGLGKGTFAQARFYFLNAGLATRFVAYQAVDAVAQRYPGGTLEVSMREDREAIWRMGAGKGPSMTINNAVDILRGATKSAWLPVQKEIAQAMGDVKVARKDRYLIAPEQVEALGEVLEPGDILLERREWYLSNLGLPGFWTHAALYVGTAGQRREYFAALEDGAGLEPQLSRRYPEKYKHFGTPDGEGHERSVIEAVGEGVVMSSLVHTATADSVAVLRPRLPLAAKAEAVRRAFHYVGRPYDFDFDFVTDAALVCSELVYKADEPTGGLEGLHFTLTKVAGKLLLAPNQIAELYDAEAGGEAPQLDFVYFLDGVEAEGRAVVSDEQALRSSWTRPKWHVFMQ